MLARRIQKNKYRARNSSAVDQTTERPRKARVLVTTVSHVKRSLRQPNVGTGFWEKQDQRKTLQSRDIRQVHNKRRVEVDCQKRYSLKEDVCCTPGPTGEQRAGNRQRSKAAGTTRQPRKNTHETDQQTNPRECHTDPLWPRNAATRPRAPNTRAWSLNGTARKRDRR